MSTIINKVAESGLITLDLEKFMPDANTISTFDIEPLLFKGLILREKDFRDSLSTFDFSIYKDKHVGIFCSADALIPMWAYMLISSYIINIATSIHFGNEKVVENALTLRTINELDITPYIDGRIVIKGCGDRNASEALYVAISQKLLPISKSIMYGEPCSTVPIYKKKKTI